MEGEGEGDRLSVTDASGDTAADADKNVDAAAAAAAAGCNGDGGSGGTEQESVALSVSAATENLSKAVRSFVLDDDEGAAAVTAAAGDHIQSPARKKSSATRQAFSRAFGQLHLGAEKGSGVMSSMSGSVTVWGALLRECKGALDQR